MYVCLSVSLSTVFLDNCGSSECETWTYVISSKRHTWHTKILERRRSGKLVKRTAAQVSVHQIEIAHNRCLVHRGLRMWRNSGSLYSGYKIGLLAGAHIGSVEWE